MTETVNNANFTPKKSSCHQISKVLNICQNSNMYLPKINSTVTNNQYSGLGYLYDIEFLFWFVGVSLFILIAYLVGSCLYFWYQNREQELIHARTCSSDEHAHRIADWLGPYIGESLFVASAPFENTTIGAVKNTDPYL